MTCLLHYYTSLIIIHILPDLSCSLEKFVTQTDGTVLSQPQYLVLVKWWRTDNRGGKSSWMNITRARVLQMSPPPGSKNLKLGGTSRRSASSVSNEDGSDEMKQIKR